MADSKGLRFVGWLFASITAGVVTLAVMSTMNESRSTLDANVERTVAAAATIL